ncbi:MAG: zinc-dependent alcohol dehydrogenase family protein [Pleurocapsa sp. MO_226.B13]|nr:zinc-dependent alcohol dehydrogenase family protein [Pleurocapsa sp. MO_226.B13]
MVKIVRFYDTGDADVLQLEDLPLPEPDRDEVRIKIEAIGLNRAEVMFRSGRYLLKASQFPALLGYEAAGIIDKIDAGVSGFKIGDRVSIIPLPAMIQYGVYGEVAIVPASAIARYPEHLSPSEAAAIWMAYLTAYGAMVEYGQVKSGDFVLITAASSSVGYAAIQIVKAAGATVIATTRNAAKKQKLLDNGADFIIVTSKEDLAPRMMEISSGNGANIIFDAIAGRFLNTLVRAAALGATIFEYGALAPGGLDESSAMTAFPLSIAIEKGLKVQGYSIFEITNNPNKLEQAMQYIYNGLESGQLKPILDRTFPLEQIVAAHRYMESNQQNGKIIVTVA